jgi:uncharacterized protein YutE (UPF0331/DUF86 family)
LTPSTATKRILADRLEWIDRMVNEIRSLPLATLDDFSVDSRNVRAAESCLRRALEALFDIGRHILAKAFGKGVSEYKEIANELQHAGVLSNDQTILLRTLAGYRNRLVHFDHEVSTQELHGICKDRLDDLLQIKGAYLTWVRTNPDKVDETL